MVPPIDPAGYAVDFIRSAYSTTMDFGDGNPIPICWYFVPPGTPFLPIPGVFRSRNWETYMEWLEGPGEIYKAPRPWRNGSRCRAAPLGCPIGTPEQWINGITPGTPYVEVVVQGAPEGTLCNIAGLLTAEARLRLSVFARTRTRGHGSARPLMLVGGVAHTSASPSSRGAAGLALGANAAIYTPNRIHGIAGLVFSVQATTSFPQNYTACPGIKMAAPCQSHAAAAAQVVAEILFGASAITSTGPAVPKLAGFVLNVDAITQSLAASDGFAGLLAGETASTDSPAVNAASAGILAGCHPSTSAPASQDGQAGLKAGVSGPSHAPATATSAVGVRTSALAPHYSGRAYAASAQWNAGQSAPTEAPGVAAGSGPGTMGIVAVTRQGHGVAGLPALKLGTSAVTAGFGMSTPSGGCGSLPSIMKCRGVSGTGTCTGSSFSLANLVYSSVSQTWTGTSGSGATLTNWTLSCVSGSWMFGCSGYLNSTGTGFTLSGTVTGPSPNISGTATMTGGCTGTLTIHITRT